MMCKLRFSAADLSVIVLNWVDLVLGVFSGRLEF